MADAVADSEKDADSTYYWSVDIPGLDQEQAEALVLLIENQNGLNGIALNPAHWLTLHIDRETAEVIRAALALGETGAIGDGLLEDIDEWLGSSASGPVTDEDK